MNSGSSPSAPSCAAQGCRWPRAPTTPPRPGRRIVDELTQRGVQVRFVKEGLTFSSDESDPCAVLMLSVMGAVAEFERSMILERQREGIALAKAAGKYKGRKAALTAEQADELRARLAEGKSVTALAKEFGVSRQTVYNYAA